MAPSAGTVTLQIRADTSALDADLARAKREIVRFDRAVLGRSRMGYVRLALAFTLGVFAALALGGCRASCCDVSSGRGPSCDAPPILLPNPPSQKAAVEAAPVPTHVTRGSDPWSNARCPECPGGVCRRR